MKADIHHPKVEYLKNPQYAQNKANNRHSNKSKQVRLTQALKLRIANLMKHEKWSLELIAKRLSLEGEHRASLPMITEKSLLCIKFLNR